MPVEKIDTLVVGGGQAGIAMSEHLSVNGVPHFVFHASHQGMLSDGDAAAQLIALATPIVVAVALLALEWRRREATT